jgi:serine/threonine protein phosphatase PrpC
VLADDQIAAIVSAQGDPQSACEQLVAEANARSGSDNVTAVVMRFESPA